jgi:hypothetical protein
MKLTDYVDALAYETAFAIAAFTRSDYPIDALGAVCVQACAKLRAARPSLDHAPCSTYPPRYYDTGETTDEINPPND